MNCPDIDRVIDYQTAGPGSDDEFEGHLARCERCRKELFMIQELLASLHPEIEVPEVLVQRTHSALFPPGGAPARTPYPLSQGLAAGAVGMATALLTLVVAGAGFSSGPALPLIASLLVGVASVVVQGWMVRTGRAEILTDARSLRAPAEGI